MNETTTNGAPVRLNADQGRVSLDELIYSLNACGDSRDPTEVLTGDPELFAELQRIRQEWLLKSDQVPPRHPGLRKGVRRFTLGGVGLALIFAALLVALAAYLGAI